MTLQLTTVGKYRVVVCWSEPATSEHSARVLRVTACVRFGRRVAEREADRIRTAIHQKTWAPPALDMSFIPDPPKNARVLVEPAVRRLAGAAVVTAMLLVVPALLASACGGSREERTPEAAPSAPPRFEFVGEWRGSALGPYLYAVCDRAQGNLVYISSTNQGGGVAVVTGGCR